MNNYNVRGGGRQVGNFTALAPHVAGGETKPILPSHPDPGRKSGLAPHVAGGETKPILPSHPDPGRKSGLAPHVAGGETKPILPSHPLRPRNPRPRRTLRATKRTQYLHFADFGFVSSDRGALWG